MTTPDTDTRPALSAVEALAQLRKELDDLRSTMMARTLRRPTGDIEPTLRTTAKPDTLLLTGQTVSRATYAGLWAWVAEQGLSPSVFGAGDGSTTFVLPDLRGRVLSGADASRAVGTKFGAQTRVITPDNMASHTHQVGVDIGSATNAHQHGFQTAGVGDHGFHRPWNAIGPGGGGAEWTTNQHQGGGAHGHSGLSANDGPSHEHFVAVFESTVGDNDPLNIEQPSYAVGWLIWT